MGIGRGLFQIQVVQYRRNNYCIAALLHSSKWLNVIHRSCKYVVASELKDPICHSDECQIGSFSSEATMFLLTKMYIRAYIRASVFSNHIFFLSSSQVIMLSYLSFSMFCPPTTNYLTRFYLQFIVWFVSTLYLVLNICQRCEP